MYTSQVILVCAVNALMSEVLHSNSKPSNRTAGVGMASNIFTSITRLFNAPLLAVTTSTVAAAAAAAAAGSEQQSDQEKGAAAAAATAAAEGKLADLQDGCLIEVHDGNSSSGRSSSTDLVIMVESPSPKAAAAAADVDLEQPLLDKEDLISSDRCKQQQQQRSCGLSAAVSAAVWLALAFSMVEVSCYVSPSSGLSFPAHQCLSGNSVSEHSI